MKQKKNKTKEEENKNFNGHKDTNLTPAGHMYYAMGRTKGGKKLLYIMITVTILFGVLLLYSIFTDL